jgi:hypothetical protein
MRQKSWNAIKIGGPRPERNQRSPPRKPQLDNHYRYRNSCSPTIPKAPSHLFNNQRGFFNWSRWDGSLWDTTALKAHHSSNWFHVINRTTNMFRHAKNRLGQGAHAEHEEFWVNYYRATACAINSVQSLHLLVIESNAIAFILRTASKQYSNRTAELSQAFVSTTVDLHHLYKDLYQMRRIMVHRTQNPEYFKAGVEHFRIMTSPRQAEKRNLIRDRALRLQLKQSDGQQWARSHKVRHTSSDWKESARGFEATMHAYPPHWTIEPLKTSIKVMLSRLHISISSVDNYIYVNRTRKMSPVFRKIRRLNEIILAGSRELHELLDEMVALRYYRLHRFPDVSLGSEVELGRRLWQRLLPEAPFKSNVPVTNGRGFFSWERWTGNDWNTEELQPYLADNSVRAAAHAQANYDAMKLRVSRTAPREMDVFLMAHYKSQWIANKRMHAFARLQCDLSVLLFLLRTAPPRITQHLTVPITEFGILNYSLNSDLEVLRKLSTIIACLPHNPLLFKSLAKRYEEDRDAQTLTSSFMLNLKCQRSKFKAASGFKYNLREFEYDQKGLRKEVREIKFLRSVPYSWKYEFPSNVIEPFQHTVNLIAVRQQRLLGHLRGLFRCSDSYTDRTWGHQVQVLNEAEQDVARLMSLGQDLAAIRYYKIHRFPNSFSETILALDRARIQRMTSPFYWKGDEEAPVRGKQKQEKKKLWQEEKRLWEEKKRLRAENKRQVELRQEKKRKKDERREELAQKNKERQIMAHAMTLTEKQTMVQTTTPIAKDTGRMPRRKKTKLKRRKDPLLDTLNQALASQTHVN